MLIKLIMYGLVLWLAIWGYRQYQQPSTRVSVGMKAPDFTLPDADGNMRSLSDWQGKWLVLYFIPKMIRQDAREKPASSGMISSKFMRWAQRWLV